MAVAPERIVGAHDRREAPEKFVDRCAPPLFKVSP